MLYDPKWKAPTENKPLETWQKVLLVAATAIETHGHAKNTMRIEGRMCALGAMEFACKNVRASMKADYQAWKALKRIVGSGNIADWNDAPERTSGEVIDALRRAAGE